MISIRPPRCARWHQNTATVNNRAKAAVRVLMIVSYFSSLILQQVLLRYHSKQLAAHTRSQGCICSAFFGDNALNNSTKSLITSRLMLHASQHPVHEQPSGDMSCGRLLIIQLAKHCCFLIAPSLSRPCNKGLHGLTKHNISAATQHCTLNKNSAALHSRSVASLRATLLLALATAVLHVC